MGNSTPTTRVLLGIVAILAILVAGIGLVNQRNANTQSRFESLQNFTKEAICPACGHDTIRISVCRDTRYSRCIGGFDRSMNHVHRSCSGCEHEWLEKFFADSQTEESE